MSTSILGSWNVWWLSDWRIISLSDNVRRYINDVEHADAICFLQTLGQICLLLLRKWTTVPTQKHIIHSQKILGTTGHQRFEIFIWSSSIPFFATFFQKHFPNIPQNHGFLPVPAQLQPPVASHGKPQGVALTSDNTNDATTTTMTTAPTSFLRRLGEVWKPRWFGDVFCCWPKEG